MNKCTTKVQKKAEFALQRGKKGFTWKNKFAGWQK
jgi:hypothetical protein